MIKRTIEVSQPSYLKFGQGNLLIEQNHVLVAKVPFEDLGVLILANYQIVVTQQVVEACGQNNVVIVHCNAKHMPISLTLPISGHSLHTKALQQQIQISKVRKKQLWQQIVKEKIKHQVQTLERANKPSEALVRLIDKVKSDDKTNIEAQAAKKYWRVLFGEAFRRDPDIEGVNALLNYGYAIIRAVVARAIVGTGFHPALGLNHSNQYNAYCLADDVMEPFRPWVDEIVFNLNTIELNRETKTSFLQLLDKNVMFNKQSLPFMVALSLFVAQLKEAYADTNVALSYPLRN